MLNRKDFDRYMNFFDKEFDKKLTEVRKELLYQKVSFLNTTYFSIGLISVIERFNRHQLPTVETIFNMTLESIPFESVEDTKKIAVG